MATHSRHIRYSSHPAKSFPSYHISQKTEDIDPGFFIVRPNGGPLVPLIPVDELPIGLEFVGLSRSIEVEDTIGMGNLGIRTNRVGCWKLVGAGDAKKDNKLPSAAVVTSSKHSISTPPSTPPTGNGFANTSPAVVVTSAPVVASTPTQLPHKKTDQTTPARPALAPQTAQTPQSTPINTSVAAPLPTATTSTIPNEEATATPITTGTGIVGPFEPQICRHWCAYGNCKWGNNCRYLHIMPTSPSGLLEVGLADWPAWWKNLFGVPSSASSSMTMHSSSGGTRHVQNIYGGRGGPKHKEKERERERIGMLSVYPTGPRERFSRGLDIDYGRSGGDAARARAWEEKLMALGGSGAGDRVRGGIIQELDIRMLKGAGNGQHGQGVNGKGKGKGKKGLVKTQYLQPVIIDGKVVGLGVADGAALKKAITSGTAGDVKGKEKEKLSVETRVKLVPSQDLKVLAKAAMEKKKENEKALTTGKKLDRDVARATMAWEDDVDDEGDDNKENVAPIVKEVGKGAAGVLVDI